MSLDPIRKVHKQRMISFDHWHYTTVVGSKLKIMNRGLPLQMRLVCHYTGQQKAIVAVEWSTVYIAPNFRGIIFSWISWLTPRSQIFYLQKFYFGGVAFSRALAWDALNIKPGFDTDMTLLAYFKKSNPSKAVLPSPTGPLSLQNAILLYWAREAANKCAAEVLERTSDSTSELATKSTKRGTYENYTPKQKAETSCYAWYHSHNKASPCLVKLCSHHEIF